jgi:hypothetical protein
VVVRLHLVYKHRIADRDIITNTAQGREYDQASATSSPGLELVRGRVGLLNRVAAVPDVAFGIAVAGAESKCDEPASMLALTASKFVFQT